MYIFIQSPDHPCQNRHADRNIHTSGDSKGKKKRTIQRERVEWGKSEAAKSDGFTNVSFRLLSYFPKQWEATSTFTTAPPDSSHSHLILIFFFFLRLKYCLPWLLATLRQNKPIHTYRTAYRLLGRQFSMHQHSNSHKYLYLDRSTRSHAPRSLSIDRDRCRWICMYIAVCAWNSRLPRTKTNKQTKKEKPEHPYMHSKEREREKGLDT